MNPVNIHPNFAQYRGLSPFLFYIIWSRKIVPNLTEKTDRKQPEKHMFNQFITMTYIIKSRQYQKS